MAIIEGVPENLEYDIVPIEGELWPIGEKIVERHREWM